MEKRSCDNRYYIPNLTTTLKKAIEQKDIETIITLASELENFKVICGYTPAIQQFEESLTHYGREMNLLDQPEIKRALNTIPHKTCCECCESEQPPHREGFLAQVEASRGIQNNPTREPEPETLIKSEFQAMLSASSKSVERQREQHPLIRRQMSFDYENQLPLICTESCPIKRHCGSFPSNEGRVCVKQTEQYKNKYFVRSMK